LHKILFVTNPGFAESQARTVADVQNVNIVFAHGEKDSVLVLTGDGGISPEFPV
jgi:hypothetical protein